MDILMLTLIGIMPMGRVCRMSTTGIGLQVEGHLRKTTVVLADRLYQEIRVSRK